MKKITNALNYFKLCGIFMLFLTQQSFAQQQVSGKVTDSEGIPTPGVNVVEKGTSNGVVTDFEGTFNIEVSEPDAVLQFSFMGYQTQEVSVQGRNVINVEMSTDMGALEEVVLIGYGAQSRETVTGAISTVNADDFNSGMINDPMTLISGKVAGLSTSNPSADPNATADFSLRGPATISGNSQPLIVIDGVPGGDLQTIAPSNIASIDVLKDASAAAIYGSRATAGVIIVTTKKGVPGEVRVNYSSYISTDVVSNEYDVLDADQYVALGEEYGFTVDDAGANTDWFDEVTRTPISHVHNLSVSGGNEKTTYYAGVNYQNFQGIDLISERENLNGTFKLNTTAIQDKLNFSFMLTNSHDNRDFANYGSLAQSLKMNPTYPVKNPDGTWYQRPDIQYGLQWNPVASMYTNTNNSKESRLLGNVKVDYNILSGLNASISYSLIKNSFLSGSYSSREDFFQQQEGVGGQASRSQDHTTSNIVEATLAYTTSIAEDHNLDFLAGYSYQNTFNEGFSAGNNSFNTDAFLYYNLGAGGALNNFTPNFNRSGVFVGSYGSERTLAAFFGRIIYDYKKKYLLNISARREGASVLGRDNKWDTFSGVSAGWIISKEDFLHDNETIQYLKLRGGYGITGNQESLSPYQSLATMGPYFGGSHNAYIGNPGEGSWVQPYGPIINPNPQLQWETKKELNLGIDFALFENGWLSGSMDYYNRKIENLVGNYTAQVPSQILPEIFANAGSMKNEGFELALNAQLFDNDNFKWSTDFVGSYNKNEIISVTSNQFQGSAHDITRVTEGVSIQRLAPGQPVAAFYGRVFAGFTEEGDWLFENSEGDAVVASEIGEDDFRYLGNSIPKYSLGLTNNFRVGNFDASVLIRSALGYNAVNGKRMFHENLSYYSRQNLFESVLDEPIQNSPLFSSYYIEDGGYVKLDNLTIGYTLPMENNRYIKNIRVYMTGTNLITVTDFSGNDPELGINYYPSDPESEVSNGPSVEPYYDYYPVTSSFTFGINANF
ncbi:SusC/RagA family TonB-linked outer membrane protein [Zunongwangia pacifica]|uniref:SusC/RagA family TonB-linked outer membrane protein n=1 Tax=Zunongwangia pacifica TaxID=2911062 RepID=A0A9X1ZLQ4_9FLAO|nr:SusC/RagA family TonB-linked outer membrane protein [Zunongwangia pacifica]MCL6217032.1 SusC/RagA family TonB-linked outer membrane protein [Zunongwangia pacifica]